MMPIGAVAATTANSLYLSTVGQYTAIRKSITWE